MYLLTMVLPLVSVLLSIVVASLVFMSLPHHIHTHTHSEFYHRLGFREVVRLPDYYTVLNGKKDGLLCCSYVNGGLQFTGSFRSYFRRYVGESWLCRALMHVCNSLFDMIKSVPLSQRDTF